MGPRAAATAAADRLDRIQSLGGGGGLDLAASSSMTALPPSLVAATSGVMGSGTFGSATAAAAARKLQLATHNDKVPVATRFTLFFGNLTGVAHRADRLAAAHERGYRVEYNRGDHIAGASDVHRSRKARPDLVAFNDTRTALAVASVLECKDKLHADDAPIFGFWPQKWTNGPVMKGEGTRGASSRSTSRRWRPTRSASRASSRSSASRRS